MGNMTSWTRFRMTHRKICVTVCKVSNGSPLVGHHIATSGCRSAIKATPKIWARGLTFGDCQKVGFAMGDAAKCYFGTTLLHRLNTHRFGSAGSLRDLPAADIVTFCRNMGLGVVTDRFVD